MRIRELIKEVKMSPGALQKFGISDLGNRVVLGFEAEMVMPAEGSDPSHEHDYTVDEHVKNINHIITFFTNGDVRLDNESYRKFVAALRADYAGWLASIESNEKLLNSKVIEQLYKNLSNGNRSEAEPIVRDAFVTKNENYQTAHSQVIKNLPKYFTDEQWMKEQQWTMSDVAEHYHVPWPYMIADSTEEILITDEEMRLLANDFKSKMGFPIRYTNIYHAIERTKNTWIMEPDASIEADTDGSFAGLEIISPPLPINDAILKLSQVINWAKSHDAYSNTSTGLHFNMSFPGFNLDNLDYVKLALFIGDEYVLKQFDRLSNRFCRSAISNLRQRTRIDPTYIMDVMYSLQTNLDANAGKIMNIGQTNKYTSINVKNLASGNQYIEFRSPGNDYFNNTSDELLNTALRFAQGLVIASDREMYKKEYAKKLYKLFSESMPETHSLLFANFLSGNLSKESLIYKLSSSELIRKARSPK